MKIGLALGGGGARGLAHIGVLKVLQRENIPIHCIVGCSSGAIIGAAFALSRNAQRIEDLAYKWVTNPAFIEMGLEFFAQSDKIRKNHRIDDFLTYMKIRYSFLKALNKPAIFERDTLEHIFEIFNHIRIEKLPIHFSAIATDLISGQEIVLKKGDLKLAIMASSAIPGIFPPVQIGKKLLVDGATSDSVPVHIVRERGAHRVIAVDVTKCIRKIGPLTNALHILYRADEIATFHLTQERLAGADLIIRPAVRQISWANFKQYKKLVKRGEEAAEKMLPEIFGLLESKDRN